MITIKKTVIEYTQKELRKECKQFTTKKNQLNTKDSNVGNKGPKSCKEYKN